MSVSGYVNKDYEVAITNQEEDVEEVLPYGSVVKELSIQRKVDQAWSEIAVPCIIQSAVYRVDFKIDIGRISRHLPENIKADKIELIFFEGIVLEEDEATEFTQWIKKDKKFYNMEISKNEIKGSLGFSINKDYRTLKGKTFLFLALKIDQVVIKYFVLDIAVITNCQQITKDYKLALGGVTQKVFKPAFWYSKEVFHKDGAKKKRERSRDGDQVELKKESVVEEGPQSTIKKRLKSMIETTQLRVLAMEKLIKSEDPLTEADISRIALEMIASNVSLVVEPRKAIPDLLYPILGDPMFYETRFVDEINFDVPSSDLK